MHKINFHATHAEFEGNFSIDLYLSLEDGNVSFLVNKTIVDQLLELENSLIKLTPSLLNAVEQRASNAMNEWIGFFGVNILYELSNLYAIVGFLLVKMTRKYEDCSERAKRIQLTNS